MKLLYPTEVTDSILVSTNVPETEYAAWAVGTTYATGDKVIKNHAIWASADDDNTGNDPEESGSTHWVYYSATNAWKLFDQKVIDKTVMSGSIELTLAPGRISGITLLNVTGNTVTVTITDPVEGAVFTKVVELISTANVIDLYTYFFAPFMYTKNVYIETPIYGDSTLSIVIEAESGSAECGEIVLGLFSELGYTQYGSSTGIQDYSTKQVDAFGNFTILQRAFAKRGKFNLLVDNSLIPAVISMLEEFRTTPVVWIPTDDTTLSSPLIVYGYYRDFEASVNYYNESSLSIELEGLT